jgi:hypothetical protein
MISPVVFGGMNAAQTTDNPFDSRRKFQDSRSSTMKTPTNVTSGLRVKTGIKAGGLAGRNHNSTTVRAK